MALAYRVDGVMQAQASIHVCASHVGLPPRSTVDAGLSQHDIRHINGGSRL